MNNVFADDFAYITVDNILEYISVCVDYILENINGFKQEIFPDLDTNMTYGEVIEGYIEPYLRMLSDDKEVNEFDYLFMLKHKTLAEYVSKFDEITRNNNSFEQIIVTACLGFKRIYSTTISFILTFTTIDDYDEVDNVLCEYFANEFYSKRKKIMFEHSLDPIGSRDDYDRLLIENQLIIELGELCVRKSNKTK